MNQTLQPIAMHAIHIALLVALLALPTRQPVAAPAPSGPTERQAEVRNKGEHVMPFALGKTIHSFDKTFDGGIQRVRVRGEALDQVAMIRSHLGAIAKAFAARDFDQPMHIHGAGMPGLAAMKSAGPTELRVTYRELLDGGEIVYVAHSARMVEAVHAWFDAQLADHGSDAVASPAPTRIDDLAWLAGDWLQEDADRRTEEHWTTPVDGMMIGMSREVRHGATGSFEFLRIVARRDGVFLLAQPQGKPPVEFPLRIWDGYEAVFVNPGNSDRLHRVVYRRSPDGSLTARFEGEDDGHAFSQEFAYRRASTAAASR